MATDIKQYWKEIAGKAGLDPAKVEQVEQVLADESVQKTITDGFVLRPDYSRDLDRIRDESVKKGASQKEAEYQQWYEQEKAKYESWVQGEQRLREYEQRYGALPTEQPAHNPNPSTPHNPAGNPSTLSRAEAEQIWKEREEALREEIRKRDTSYLDYTEIREDHRDRFGAPLDRAAFEQFYKEHPELGTMRSAYDRFIQPELEKRRDAEIEQRVAAAREEGIRDGASRRALPSDTGPKPFSPFYDRDAKVAELSDTEQEQHSRTAFFEGLDGTGDEGAKSA